VLVVDVESVVEHLLNRARWGASRSSGTGGQHRDKASTRAELTVDSDSLVGLDSAVAERLAERLGLDDRPLRLLIQDERSLTRNRQIAAVRLGKLVAGALALPPPPRRPTRPKRAVREARLADKAHRAGIKRQRRAPPTDA
jgi:ribosome-associated protein